MWAIAPWLRMQTAGEQVALQLAHQIQQCVRRRIGTCQPKLLLAPVAKGIECEPEWRQNNLVGGRLDTGQGRVVDGTDENQS